MELFNTIALLVTLSAVFSFLNFRYLKLPMTIGLIIISLVMSISLILLEHVGIHFGITEKLAAIDFNKTVLVGILSFLLFAGALHININSLLDHWVSIGIFATFGVILSTFIVGTAVYYLFVGFHFNVGYMDCLLFGALISPTDPIAVLGILKRAKAPKDLAVRIAGESLFNDGVGVVVFVVLLSLVSGANEISAGHVAWLFGKEVLGGIILGLALGGLGFQALKRVDRYEVEVLITLALVTGGYALALNLHISGPIAIVIAGLMIGNHGRKLAMTETTRRHLDTFWELIDVILNAVLFVLVGLEVLVISFAWKYLLLGAVAIPMVLFSRFVCIGIPVTLLKPLRRFSPHTIKILTWGGLRGGISIALALSLPAGTVREVLLTMTYTVVVFSLVVQGLTIKHLVQK